MATKRLLPHNHLAEGEATGHWHAAEGATALYEVGDGIVEFDATPGVIVTHQEHRAIVLPATVMRSGICREYDHFAEEAKGVRD